MDASRLADRKDYYEYAGVGLSDQPAPFLLRCRMSGIGRDEGEGVIERGDWSCPA
jgi:hypothetical protein